MSGGDKKVVAVPQRPSMDAKVGSDAHGEKTLLLLQWLFAGGAVPQFLAQRSAT